MEPERTEKRKRSANKTNTAPVEPASRPALTPEARENQLIALAVDLAEKQMREGTASVAVIAHYLRLGSTKERVEREMLEKRKELADAKMQSMQVQARIEELYSNALDAMRRYSGKSEEDLPDG